MLIDIMSQKKWGPKIKTIVMLFLKCNVHKLIRYYSKVILLLINK